MRVAHVLFKDVVAGTLVEESTGKTRFSYLPTWQSEIACCFPTSRREYEWNGLHPFFQHLGPEGWLRERQTRVAHIQEEDDLGILLKYGADCIGAVSIRPQNVEAPALKISESIANPGRTVSGVQKKLLATKENGQFYPALAQGAAPYIAKFNARDIDSLVQNELLSLRWVASVLGKEEVTEFELARVDDINEVALIVKRFDRNTHGAKLRLEDCAQILSQPRGVDYSGKYNASYEDIASIILRYSVRPQIDLAKFYKRLIVYALMGNCDAHLKNFSLLETPDGLRLSPVYDVLNTAIYQGYDQNFALSIQGKKVHIEEINHRLLVNFGKEMGLPEKAIEQIFSDLERQVIKSSRLIEPSPMDDMDSFKARFEEIVRNACIRILKK